MKASSSYMTRALKSRDPRYAVILRKLGHKAPAKSKPKKEIIAKDPAAADADKAKPADPVKIEPGVEG
jgi:hypothetical protein